MNKDIRLSTDFLSNFKVRKLRRLLGDAAALSLIALWIFAAQRRPGGVLSGMDVDDIATAADWTGDPEAFVSTLVDVGLLDQTDDGLAIHDWEENNPWAAGATRRSAIAKENANKRWRGSDASGIATGIANGNAPSPSPSPSPLPSPSPRESTPERPEEVFVSEKPSSDAGVEATPTGATKPKAAPRPKRRSSGHVYPDWYERFYAASPFEDKFAGYHAAMRWNPDESLITQFFEGLDRWKQSRRWAEGFVCSGAVWFNQRRWESRPEPAGACKPGAPVLAQVQPAGVPPVSQPVDPKDKYAW